MSEQIGVAKTNLAQLWKRETELVEFPSGLKAEMTRPDAMSMLTQSNDVPDTFFALIMEAQSTGEIDMASMSPAEMREFFRMMMFLAEQLAVEHFTSPSIVPNPDYALDQISLKDLRGRMSMDDKMFLTNWAMGGGSPVDALKRFRDEQAQRLVAASNGKVLRGASLPDSNG